MTLFNGFSYLVISFDVFFAHTHPYIHILYEIKYYNTFQLS
jgi:hypothetical protein